jgi:cbb3-type cytochrome oxidase subunit 3
MRKIHLGKALLLALLLCCFFAVAAHALQVNLKNNDREAIYAVLVYYDLDRDDWIKYGWFEVHAGQTSRLDLPAEIGTIYYYARNAKDNRAWTVPDGHPQASADDIVNEPMHGPAADTPTGSGHKYVNFIEFNFDTDAIDISFNE